MLAENVTADSAPPATLHVQTVGDWFAALDPAPPAALADVLRDTLSQSFTQSSDNVPEVCLDAADVMLANLLQSGSTQRASALTLLAVDALVTYAFEAAASDGTRIESRTAAAMMRIAKLAELS